MVLSSIITVKNLRFGYPKNEVLKGIDLTLHDNELVCLLGVNGAGKSTLLKCILGILKHQSGNISYGNVAQAINVGDGNTSSQSISSEDLDPMQMARYMSYVPQSVKSSFSIDVYDTIMLGRRPYIGWSISELDREIVSKTIEFLNLEDFAFRKFNQLSGGERQRVIIGKAIAQSPRVFVLDEPTSDLDLKNQIQVMKKLKILVSDENSPKAALVAIHDINMAARFADRILLMSDGEIIAGGTPRDVLTPENIQKVFGVTSDVIESQEDNRFWIHVKDEIGGELEHKHVIWEHQNNEDEG
ncbi:MAG: Hemin import ATP-binding protein HmuV [Candidatus Poseidoniaceae archaeon]|nr:MAG: Hemin import ATP-binding protein HmuV [Candidatus Poseidoniaceae archaeon]|tara:strand:- start:8917 stop:9816 length:900 start_codon:yes stop_codon:yes gene_type:complete